jgi:hypothetical protein
MTVDISIAAMAHATLIAVFGSAGKVLFVAAGMPAVVPYMFATVAGTLMALMIIVILVIVVTTVVGVAIVVVAEGIESSIQPVNREDGRNAPEKPGSKTVPGGIGVVVNRITIGIVRIRRIGLIHDNSRRFIVRDVNDVGFSRFNFYDETVQYNFLVFITLKVAGRVGSLAEVLNCIE